MLLVPVTSVGKERLYSRLPGRFLKRGTPQPEMITLLLSVFFEQSESGRGPSLPFTYFPGSGLDGGAMAFRIKCTARYPDAERLESPEVGNRFAQNTGERFAWWCICRIPV